MQVLEFIYSSHTLYESRDQVLVIQYAGVSMASLTELSFNWTGFISAMISNISFTYRSIYSKKAMVHFYTI